MPTPWTAPLKGTKNEAITGPGKGRIDANGALVRTDGPDPTGGAVEGKPVSGGKKLTRISKKKSI
jgi:hypothetical protein